MKKSYERLLSNDEKRRAREQIKQNVIFFTKTLIKFVVEKWLKLKTLSVFSGTENFPARSLKGNWICWMMGFQIYCFRTGTFQDFSCFKRGFSGSITVYCGIRIINDNETCET